MVPNLDFLWEVRNRCFCKLLEVRWFCDAWCRTSSKEPVQNGRIDAKQTGDLLLRAGETSGKCTSQPQEVLSFKLMMRSLMEFIQTNGPDLLLHLRIGERKFLLDAMCLFNDGLQVETPQSVEEVQTAADHLFHCPVIHETLVQDAPIDMFPVRRNLDVCPE